MKILKKIFQENTFAAIFRVLAILLFSALLFFCLRYTGLNSGGVTDELIYLSQDNMLLNLLKLIPALLVFWLLGKLYDRFGGRLPKNLFLAAVCLVSCIVSVYWVFATSTIPQSDQILICEAAVHYNAGDFHSLAKGGYVARCPQQLGMITLLRLFFLLFGEWNYLSFQIFSALLVPLIIYAGCRIVRVLTNRNGKAEFFYLLLMLFCVPLYGYAPFIYNEICSTAAAMTAIWLFLECLDVFEKEKRNMTGKNFRKIFPWKRCIAAGLMLGCAIQLRNNVLIPAIAMGIVLLVKLLGDNKKATLILLVSLLTGSLCFHALITGLYRDKKPEDAYAIPSILYVVMGLNDDLASPGWFNGYHHRVIMEYEDDPVACRERGRQDLQAYLETYRSDPSYMVHFFLRKMQAQWMSPMYQCIVMNNKVEGEQSKLAASIYAGELPGVILERFMKIFQLLCYAMVLFWLCVSPSGKKRSIEQYTLLIAVFGGFLFSLIWEAKARYVFPYLIFMIPYMAAGLQTIEDKIKK